MERVNRGGFCNGQYGVPGETHIPRIHSRYLIVFSAFYFFIMKTIDVSTCMSNLCHCVRYVVNGLTVNGWGDLRER